MCGEKYRSSQIVSLFLDFVSILCCLQLTSWLSKFYSKVGEVCKYLSNFLALCCHFDIYFKKHFTSGMDIQLRAISWLIH